MIKIMIINEIVLFGLFKKEKLRLFKKPKEIPSPDNELIKGKIDAMPKVSSKEAEIIKMESLKIDSSHFSLKENKFYVMYKSLLLFNSEKTFKACVFKQS